LTGLIGMVFSSLGEMFGLNPLGRRNIQRGYEELKTGFWYPARKQGTAP